MSGQLTLPGIPVGAHRVDVLKEGYGPFTAMVTVANGQTAPVTATLTNEDGDGDGLPDYYEENGYRDGFGRWHTLDPDTVDTDGDGLSDGYEAGEMVIDANGKTYFKQRSDPTKADTDGDGLDDYLEDAIESDPLCADSDGDGLSDALEWNIVGTDLWSADTDEDGHSDAEEWNDPDYDPLVFEERYGPLEMGREFLLGAVLGEWGADDHDNLFYLGGWVASGVIVIGDLRDIAATISRGDLVGTGLNLAALIPGYGDAAKAAAVVGKFVLKHPELLKPAMVLLVGVAPYVDEAAEWANNFRKLHGDDAVDKFLINGITESDLNVIAKNRGNLLKTLEVVKRSDGKVVWLEEGLTEAEAMARGVRPSGWKHIREDHFPDLVAANQFADVFGDAYKDESKIRELIIDGAKYGQKVSDAGAYHYVEPNSGKILLLVIGSNGYLVTAYPFRVK
ncbi:MAG: PEGA domain-containing protein [Candidatus Cloacimonetes bacterium]|nr:PEGA domain-containing protein [Candidatus Cloacimonadota bacterium]